MSRFVYVTYIRTTPEKLWAALTEPQFTRQYWGLTWQESDWKVGSPWKIMIPDGRVGDSGEIVEADYPRRLVLTWRNEFMPELREEGYSRLTYELEPMEPATVKLAVTHEMDREPSKLIEAVSQGWPHILASLKSLLETGESLAETRDWPEEHAAGGEATVTVVQRFSASPEQVFDAWVDPRVARRWLFATETGEITLCEIDARLGGAWRIIDRRPDGEADHRGEYLEIDRPRRLVMTMQVGGSALSRLAVDITPANGGCELTLTHEVDPEYAERTQGGWTKLLGELASLLG